MVRYFSPECRLILRKSQCLEEKDQHIRWKATKIFEIASLCLNTKDVGCVLPTLVRRLLGDQRYCMGSLFSVVLCLWLVSYIKRKARGNKRQGSGRSGSGTYFPLVGVEAP